MIDPKTLVAASLSLAGGAGTSIGYMHAEFTPYRDFSEHVAQDRTRTVLDLIEVLARTSPEDVTHQTLCNALQEQIALICSEAEAHPFCVDRAMLLAKAGCR